MARLEPEDRRKLQTPGAVVRKAIVQRVEAFALEYGGAMGPEFWEAAEMKTGIPTRMLKRWTKPKEKENLESFLEQHGGHERRGKKRTWKVFQSRDTGCRIGKDALD